MSIDQESRKIWLSKRYGYQIKFDDLSGRDDQISFHVPLFITYLTVFPTWSISNSGSSSSGTGWLL